MGVKKPKTTTTDNSPVSLPGMGDNCKGDNCEDKKPGKKLFSTEAGNNSDMVPDKQSDEPGRNNREDDREHGRADFGTEKKNREDGKVNSETGNSGKATFGSVKVDGKLENAEPDHQNDKQINHNVGSFNDHVNPANETRGTFVKGNDQSGTSAETTFPNNENGNPGKEIGNPGKENDNPGKERSNPDITSGELKEPNKHYHQQNEEYDKQIKIFGKPERESIKYDNKIGGPDYENGKPDVEPFKENGLAEDRGNKEIESDIKESGNFGKEKGKAINDYSDHSAKDYSGSDNDIDKEQNGNNINAIDKGASEINGITANEPSKIKVDSKVEPGKGLITLSSKETFIEPGKKPNIESSNTVVKDSFKNYRKENVTPFVVENDKGNEKVHVNVKESNKLVKESEKDSSRALCFSNLDCDNNQECLNKECVHKLKFGIGRTDYEAIDPGTHLIFKEYSGFQTFKDNGTLTIFAEFFAPLTCIASNVTVCTAMASKGLCTPTLPP